VKEVKGVKDVEEVKEDEEIKEVKDVVEPRPMLGTWFVGRGFNRGVGKAAILGFSP
jgi:hypothetical protein